MTRYTVTASPKTESDLAHLWLQASDRAAVSTAADTIDKLLRDNATKRGGVTILGLRQLIICPLIAEFSVEEDDRRVTIWSIRHIGDLANGH
jgi:plasmid stabilization system protein ParE